MDSLPPFTLRPGNAQWIGARAEQQDAFGFAGCDAEGTQSPGGVLVVLADGMGGLAQGRAASRRAVATFLAEFAASPTTAPVPERLARALAAANRAVHALARETAGEGNVGTTLVAAAVRGGALSWIAAGDSRLHLYRAEDGSLTPCTEDHTLANALPPDAVADHPDRAALTSFLGLAEIPRIDASARPLALRPGDRLLLCSDGVDRVLSPAALAAPLAGAPQAAADTLIEAVRAAGQAAQDNATVAILACEPPASTQQAGRANRWRWPEVRFWRRSSKSAAPALALRTATLTQPGARADNEDALDWRPGAWALADGLGGHVGGAIASRLAVEALLAGLDEMTPCAAESLHRAVTAAAAAIRARQLEEPRLGRMRTTAVILASDGIQATWAHLGDSRLHVLRDGRIQARTLDHSVPQALVQAGELAPGALRGHEDRNRLLRTLGDDQAPRPTLAAAPWMLQPGDAFLLCSDGFWEAVTEAVMEITLAKAADPADWLARMEDGLRRQARPDQDNYSAIAVWVAPEESNQ